MKHMLWLAMAGLFASSPAMATGGLACSIDDASLKLDIEAGFSHGGTGAMFSIRGEVETRSDRAPSALRKFAIKPENLTQHWLDGGELRLQIYSETTGEADFGSFSVIIAAERSAEDELTYEGQYRMRIFLAQPMADGTENSEERTGNVSCSVG